MTKQTRVPKLRFPEFSGNWEEINFGKIFTFKTTNSFSRDKLNYETGSVRNIHYGDIHTKFKTLFNLKKEYVPFINEEVNIEKISDENYCKVGDLVIADASEDYADIGKCIEIQDLNDEKTLAGLHTFLARPELFEMSVGFSGYIMQSRKVRLQIMTIAQGTKVLSISTGRLANIILTIPPLPEQTKIANFLTAIDEKIQGLKEKKSLLEEYKKGLMQQIFSQKLRFKQDDGSDFPDWEEKTFKSVFTIGSGRDYKHLDSGNIPVFGTGGYMTSVNDYLYDGETVCIGRKGTIDKPMFFNGKIWTVDTLFYTKDFLHVLPKYIYYVFNTINWKEYNEASGVPSLSKSTIEKIQTLFPSLLEQQKIANFLSSIDKKIEKVSRQISEVESYKKGLLQQMFV